MSSTSKIPRVAIITRTRNRPIFLARAIKSVLGQSYKDYVHVILNDGGDKSDLERILAENPDSRRVIVHNKSSVGIVKALNQAIRASDSEYIVIHDDDDAWHPSRLELGVANIDERTTRANVVPMEVVIEDVDEQGSPIEVERMPHPESWSGEVSLYRQAHRNFLSNGAIMYSRELFDELNGYDETLPTAEDWDFGIRLMLRCNVEQVLSEEALVYYHQRPDVKNQTIGNSVHAGVREQERAIMMLRNNYLRDDIQRGIFGVGYIMNNLEYELNNIVRLEGHINRSTESVINTIDRVERTSVDRWKEAGLGGESLLSKMKKMIKQRLNI